MNNLFQLFFFCLFPLYLFSSSWFNWSQQKVDFTCPHHCGDWGSESIRSLEWQFIQCLYDADVLHNFIKKNDSGIENYPIDIQPLNPIFLPRPVDFQCQWYQKMQLSNPYGRLVISNNYDCFEGWAVFWKIEHVDQNGKHLGKIFHRKKYNDCEFNGTNYDFVNSEKENEADPDWNRCFWYAPSDQEKYSFKNRIDFQNACIRLEQDCLAQIQDGSYRRADYNPHFKKEMYNQLTQLSNRLQRVKDYYNLIFEECSRIHRAPSGDYELVLQQFEKGSYAKAITQLKGLLSRVNLESLDANIASHIYTSKGEAEVETIQYDEAIISLSQAIQYDPQNKDAYFERAIAYFETGQFDLSLRDYLSQEKEVSYTSPTDQWSLQTFGKGLMKGGAQGVRDSSSEFLPSICNSIYGVGNLLWMTIKHPIETPKQLAATTLEFCNYLRTCDKAELAQLLVPEMYELIVNWDELFYEKRGELMGYCLGKYGLDILLPIAAVKGFKYATAYHNIKKAEKLSVLQTLAKSPESKEALAQAAVQWSEQRQAYFAKVKIVKDMQNKHIRGTHNFDPTRSEWLHPNPESKVRQLGGKGQKIKGHPGQAGYKERVDCGEIIGYYTSKEGEKMPTTMATIHYSKEGAHIVPARPKK